MTDERPLSERIPELRSALDKLNAARTTRQGVTEVRAIQFDPAEVDALIRMYGQTEPMERPELEEVAVLKLPILVSGMQQLVTGLQKVFGESLFLPRWHQHGEGYFVMARQKSDG